jgi:uncharacterized protein (TIGR00730 family)
VPVLAGHPPVSGRPGLSSVAVYCASSPGVDPAFGAAATSMGRRLGERGIALVYGGGHVGLMGLLADAALEAGGEVHGVITRALADKELAHRGLTSLEVVDTMHQRKAAMADRAHGFIMLPGGFGTLDEFFEVVTWTQLGVHAKPCGLLDVNGFFEPLGALLDGAVRQRFIRAEHRDMLITVSDPDALLDRLSSWTPISVEKWLDRSER